MAFPIQKMQAGEILLVVHDFDARSTDELTLRKGERIELVELDDGFGDGWYLGRHLTRGGTGLFPGVYTTKVPTTFPTLQTSNIAKRISLPNQSYPSLPPNQVPYGSPQDVRESQTFTQTQKPYQGLQYSNESEQTLSQAPYSQGSFPTPQRTASMPPMQSYNSQPPRSIGQALGDMHVGQDSPVMNETLSVIAEHMQDMNSPRHNILTQEQSPPDDSASEYSSHRDHEPSDSGKLSEEEVRHWDHKQTANHLRSIGVDPKHCDIFEEQEIAGDVLLEMDQAFIYMKEYDFGVMGRRLKTWHKIRDFQDEVKGSQISRQSTSTGMMHIDSPENQLAHNRAGSSGATILPRIPLLTENQALNYAQPLSPLGNLSRNIPGPLQPFQNSQIRTNVPNSSWRKSIGESPSRPSAALVREISHSRRQSSIDSGIDTPTGSIGTPTTPHHKKQYSLDREWSMTSATQMPTATAPPSLRLSTMRQGYDGSAHTDTSSVDLVDRGYFSGGELENRKSRDILRKRESLGSPAHSRQTSYQTDPNQNRQSINRHSRLWSMDAIRDRGPTITSPAARAYHNKGYKGRMRSASERQAPGTFMGGMSPVVTNLEEGHFNHASPQTGKDSPLSPLTGNVAGPNDAHRIMGLRAISDSVTGNSASAPVSGPPTIAESPIDSPTGSTTPSRTSKSFETESADVSSKGVDAAAAALAAKGINRPRPKTKKETSAYTRGLREITPAEARENCDYSGWMKKKSSSLLTTWKVRLFVLHGRRLSYFYSETDTQERGIIDISGHKVLVANSDPIITFHASITGATSSPTPSSTISSTNTSPVLPMRSPSSSDGPFYFKLVPPKAGFSRAVQFTKPTVHYFQVDSIIDGRKWMGEMMKATIEHDLSTFETTNKQKTISLAKARARKERPPALKDPDQTQNLPESAKMDEGLKIQGLNIENHSEAASSLPLIDEKDSGLERNSVRYSDT